MAPAMSNSVLAGVFLGNRRVGTLGYRDGNTWFEYEDRDAHHPVLGQSFETNPNHRRTASGTVPEWFANLLPESESGLRRLIGQELGRESPHDFQVIVFLGEDLPGAVRIVLESDLAEIPELTKQDRVQHDYQIRFSLAGVQVKFSMQWKDKSLVLPMSGKGGDWIVKLPDRRYSNVPENEYAMLYWARLSGIDVPEIMLFTGNQIVGLPDGLIGPEEVAFGVKRFDRVDGLRVHQEDLAQVREIAPDLKYERSSYSGIARFINAVCPEDLDEYVRRLTSFVIMGNLDAHLKNWTIRYPDGRNPRLSPAYDFVSVSAYPDFNREQMAMAINGGRHANNILPINFIRFANSAKVDVERVMPVVRSTIDSMVQTWPQVKADCDIPAFLVAHIEQRLTKLPLVTAMQESRF
jgi:serine/threonine-protein kinase HipA